MTSATFPVSVVKKKPVAGYVLTGLVGLFLTFDTMVKVLMHSSAVNGTTRLGYPADPSGYINDGR